MYFYLYKITNLLDAKIYIGTHKTKNLDDGYMGSGKMLNRAIDKYGIENFKKDILEYFNTAEEMFVREKELVNDEFLLREDVYNIRRGGCGGFDHINKDKELIQKRNKKIANNRDFTNQKISIKKVKETKMYRENLSISKKKYFENNPGNFKDKSHTEENKEKISKANKGMRIGESNSQFGTMWITNGIANKKVLKDSLIPIGWYKGRKLGQVS